MSMTASVPPATTTSYSFQAICCIARPIASDPVAQALETEILAPLAPRIFETAPAEALDMILYDMAALTRLGPLAMLVLVASVISVRPPPPEPIKTATRSSFSSLMVSPDCPKASRAAAMANWVTRWTRSGFLAKTPGSLVCGSKFLISAAIWTSCCDGSNRVMRPTPDLRLIRLVQVSVTVLPKGVTAPIPVMTTRRDMIFMHSFLWFVFFGKELGRIIQEDCLKKKFGQYLLSGFIRYNKFKIFFNKKRFSAKAETVFFDFIVHFSFLFC